MLLFKSPNKKQKLTKYLALTKSFTTISKLIMFFLSVSGHQIVKLVVQNFSAITRDEHERMTTAQLKAGNVVIRRLDA